MPLVKSRAIDDVPVLGITLWSDHYDDYQLKQIGEAVTNEIKRYPTSRQPILSAEEAVK